MEALRDQWFAAPTEAAQKAICDQMQAAAFQEVPFIPLGAYRQLSALTRSLQGVIHAGNACFWGVQKA